MKINWGTGLVIGMVLFIGFIMFFVIQIMTDKNLEYDLVVEEYYKQEMVYQRELDAEKNSVSLVNNIHGARTNDGWLLTFPADVDPSKISGTVSLYRPSNKLLDFDIPIKLTNLQLLIPDAKMVAGRWNTIVNWEYEGKEYLFKEEIVY